MTNYITTWSEAIPLIHVNEKVVIQFLEQIMTRFGVSSILVFDNDAYFFSTLLNEFSLDKIIILTYSVIYYPQGNIFTESTNKNMVRIHKETIVENHRNWNNALHNALWDDMVTPKKSLGNYPYLLVYGK